MKHVKSENENLLLNQYFEKNKVKTGATVDTRVTDVIKELVEECYKIDSRFSNKAGSFTLELKEGKPDQLNVNIRFNLGKSTSLLVTNQTPTHPIFEVKSYEEPFFGRKYAPAEAYYLQPEVPVNKVYVRSKNLDDEKVSYYGVIVAAFVWQHCRETLMEALERRAPFEGMCNLTKLLNYISFESLKDYVL